MHAAACAADGDAGALGGAPEAALPDSVVLRQVSEGRIPPAVAARWISDHMAIGHSLTSVRAEEVDRTLLIPRRKCASSVTSACTQWLV